LIHFQDEFKQVPVIICLFVHIFLLIDYSEDSTITVKSTSKKSRDRDLVSKVDSEGDGEGIYFIC
jgi:hypothetical protein